MYPIIVDNLLPQGYADDIEADLTDRQFPWHYISDVTFAGYGKNGGFANVICDLGEPPGPYMSFLKPIMYSIEQVNEKKINKLLRMRVGLLLPDMKNEVPYDTPHVDFMMPHYTACYYVMDSDGDTVLFDQKLPEIGTNFTNDILFSYTQSAKFTEQARCAPVKNRLFLFDGFSFHASTKPKVSERRIVITCNFT